MRVVDMHCDTIAEIYKLRTSGQEAGLKKNRLHLDLERMREGDYGLQNFALFTDLSETEEPFEHAMKLLDTFYTEMEANRDLIFPVRTWREIEENWKAGRLSALLTIEEGAVCRGSLALLRDFYRLGVRMMTLTWNFENELGYPNRIVWEGPQAGTVVPDTEHGLTETGIAFLEEMERLGMIVDISHLNDAGIWDVFAHTRKPFVASHSNARAVASHPRNLTDEMIRRLSERGGVMGINYCAAFLRDWEREEDEESRIFDIIRHIKHIKNVGGIQCVGLGSDFDGIGGRLELGSGGALPHLAEAMEREGFLASEIEAVFSANVLRVYRELL